MNRGLVVGVPVGSEVGVYEGATDESDNLVGDAVVGVTEGVPV